MRRLQLLAAVLLAAPVANAQVIRSPAERRWGIMGGVHIGSPAKYSLALGAMRYSELELWGPFGLVEGGVRAGRVSGGYSFLRGNLPTGFTLRGSFLRVYKGRPTQNYAGIEGQITLVALGFRIGLFRPLRGGRQLIATDFSYLL